jgi:hypothetical protein
MHTTKPAPSGFFYAQRKAMKTLNLEEAAEFLKMNPIRMRQKAKQGLIPGRKTGRRWVFIEEHLADWVSGRYPEPRRELRVIDGGKLTETKKPCQSTSEKTTGGFNSPHRMASEYNALLGLKTDNKRKNCTTA